VAVFFERSRTSLGEQIGDDINSLEAGSHPVEKLFAGQKYQSVRSFE